MIFYNMLMSGKDPDKSVDCTNKIGCKCDKLVKKIEVVEDLEAREYVCFTCPPEIKVSCIRDVILTEASEREGYMESHSMTTSQEAKCYFDDDHVVVNFNRPIKKGADIDIIMNVYVPK